MSALDAGFFFAESENTPMHVGSVAVFEGPAPTYGDVVRLILGKLPKVPRYRQRVRPVPLQLGRPLWVDDPHFQILYHVRHTAVPRPGSEEQLRNLAGRVLGQRLDMAKPLWELWLVEGLADDRWALISKVHHCMVDGVAGTDLMQLMFDIDPEATHEPIKDWTPRRSPSSLEIMAGSVSETLSNPLQSLANTPAVGSPVRAVKELADTSRTLAKTVPSLAKQAFTPSARSLNGPIGPHRRWAWTEGKFEEFKAVRTAFGGTVNDVVLTAITSGFRDLLKGRGELSSEKLVVRSMVPVSVRREDQKGSLNNQVSAVFVDLPVGLSNPVDRLASIRAQMDQYKRTMGAVDANSIIAMGNFVAPTLLSLGVRAALQAGQMWCQTVTTNVPGPRVPLFVLGKRMTSATAYVPIAGGTRCSIGIFSYLNTMTFGINADFDGYPDVDVLSGGIRRGIEELLALATKQTQAEVQAETAVEAAAAAEAAASEPASGRADVTADDEPAPSKAGKTKTDETETDAEPAATSADSTTAAKKSAAKPAATKTAAKPAAKKTGAKKTAASQSNGRAESTQPAKRQPAKKSAPAKKTTAAAAR